MSVRSHYGRNPAMAALEDIRVLQLVEERIQCFGWIPPGVTLYRKSPGVWLELPDPTGCRAPACVLSEWRSEAMQ
jgi:hypothetical protein